MAKLPRFSLVSSCREWRALSRFSRGLWLLRAFHNALYSTRTPATASLGTQSALPQLLPLLQGRLPCSFHHHTVRIPPLPPCPPVAPYPQALSYLRSQSQSVVSAVSRTPLLLPHALHAPLTLLLSPYPPPSTTDSIPEPPTHSHSLKTIAEPPALTLLRSTPTHTPYPSQCSALFQRCPNASPCFVSHTRPSQPTHSPSACSRSVYTLRRLLPIRHLKPHTSLAHQPESPPAPSRLLRTRVLHSLPEAFPSCGLSPSPPSIYC